MPNEEYEGPVKWKLEVYFLSPVEFMQPLRCVRYLFVVTCLNECRALMRVHCEITFESFCNSGLFICLNTSVNKRTYAQETTWCSLSSSRGEPHNHTF